MKIRTITPVLLAGALLAGATASGTAEAQHRFRGGPRVGVYIGAPVFPYYYSPFHYPPYYYAPPVVVVPAAPTVYIEQAQPERDPQAEPQPLAPGWWYYCAEGQGYYPNVKQCPGGWQQVAPQPQGQP